MDGTGARAGVRAALMTPPGSGGIAVILVWGAGAGEAVSKVFAARSGGDWLRSPDGSLHYGHVHDAEGVVDEVVVRRGPGSGGGERVEINCHGGVVVAAEVMRLLGVAGVAEAAGGELTAAMAEPSGLDAIQREALRLLPHAESRLAVRVLCDQLDGALSRAVRSLDLGQSDGVARLNALARSAEFGCALTNPRRVVLVGRPNVGKSTLFNALVGFERTIVSPVPGTTRDFITETVEMGGYPVELADTAGLRTRGGAVEMKGVGATWRLLSEASVVVFVLDGSRRMTDAERRLLESLRRTRPIAAVSKSDLPRRLKTESIPRGLERAEVSGLTGEGIGVLVSAILRRFADPAEYPPGSPVVFTPEQARAIVAASERCSSGRPDEARRLLDSLLR